MFMGLGTLPSGSEQSLAFAISPDGSTVVGRADSSSVGTVAFVWTRSAGMSSIGQLPNQPYGVAYGVSGNGATVVGESGNLASSTKLAFRWTAASGLVALAPLAGGNGTSSASGISADASVIAGVSGSPTGDQAVIWNASGEPRGLGALVEGGQSEANAITPDGTVVVGASAVSPPRVMAFRWEAGTMVGLGDVEGGIRFNIARAVSANGRVVVGEAYLPGDFISAFSWTAESGMVALPGYNPDDSTRGALGVSSDGSIIVGFGQDTSGQAAAYWDATGIHRLQDRLAALGAPVAGWQLQRATAITPDGTSIVGFGISPTGELMAWIAVLP
jgi:probable HAF family extracellular repeat protein